MWGLNPTIAYPSSVRVSMAIVKPLVPTGRVRVAVPANFEAPLIVVRRIGGGPNAQDDTDYPVMLFSFYGDNYPAAEDLAEQAEVAILGSAMTMVDLGNGKQVLVDEAEIYIGEQELPDVYPDERRINATYRFGWRRQYIPGS